MGELDVDIALEEWQSVAEVAGRLRPAESGRVPGVVLDGADGRRRWVVQTPWVSVRLDGDAGPGPAIGPVGLPARLVARAAELAGPSGRCRLEVTGGRAVVAGELGRSTFGLPAAVHPVPERWPGEHGPTAARAEVAADLLAGAVRDGLEVPAGVDLSGRTAPDLWLVVDGRGAAVRVDWSPFGASAVEVGVPARTRGVAAVRAPGAELVALLEAVEMEGDVAVSLDPGRCRLWVHGPDWQAAVTVGGVPGRVGGGTSVGGRGAGEVGDRPGAGRVAPTLAGALAHFDLGSVDAAGWLPVAVDGHVVLAREVDEAARSTAPPVARLAVRLAEGVEGGDEVLAELNALNAEGHGLVGVRLWLADDGSVWAGTEVERRHDAELARVVRRLARSTADLGPLVAMISATGTSDVQVPGQLSLIDDP